MVLTHALRCYRYYRGGIRARAVALKELSANAGAAQTAGHPPPTGEAAHPANVGMQRAFASTYMGKRSMIKARCGLHMIDTFGHVNNAKYLELLEYSRWYHLSFLNLSDVFKRREAFLVVSALSIQYVREIKPFAEVQVTAQIVPVTDSPVALTGTESASSPANARLLNSQAIWSADGSRLHAASVVETALLGPPAYAQYLTEKYPYRPGEQPAGSDAAKSAAKAGSKPPRFVPLDTHRMLADAGQLSLEEVEAILYRSRQSFLASMAKGTSANAGVSVPASDWLSDMSSANKSWRASLRNMVYSSTPKG